MDDEPHPLIIPADLEEFPHLVAWVEAVASRLDLPSSTRFAIHLCLEEAFSNIVRHGFVGHSDGSDSSIDIRLTLARSDGTVVVTVEDGGIAFDPCTVLPPAAPELIEDAVVGGQGINLIRQFAEHMDYEHKDGMNRLSLRFTL